MDSMKSHLSADGRWVAFSAWAALVPNDKNGEDDVYVRGSLR
jgi:hypothetical protein